MAARGSILYFLLTEMSRINPMYQCSLAQFLRIFDESLSKSEVVESTSHRITSIVNMMTLRVWKYGNRGLYKSHKLLFTLLLAVKIDLQLKKINFEEFLVFIKGGASLDIKTTQQKPFSWILDVIWLNLVELSKIPIFSGLLAQIREKESEWREWTDKFNPEDCNIPNGYSPVLDQFRKLLLIRCWCPDRTLVQVEKYIAETLGNVFCQDHLLDLKEVLRESDNRTPLICLLSVGADPSQHIKDLAKSNKTECMVISMGQNQEKSASEMIENSMKSGGWVLLQNFHLSLHFFVEISSLFEETEILHEEYRLWITTEEHPAFPIALLQMSIRFTNEPPKGVPSILRRTLSSLGADFLEHSSAAQWPSIVYAVVFLHTVLQERHKFGPIGWNRRYEFNQADLNASLQFLQNHFDEIDHKKGISWTAVCYMLGEVQYGGRVTDDFDKRLLMTYSRTWFSERLLRPNFCFFQEYRIPSCRSLSQFIDYVDTLPNFDNPQLFGLHPNANITCQLNTVKAVFDTMLAIQTYEGAVSEGQTRESVADKMCQDMLSKLPQDFDPLQVREQLQKNGYLLPMTIFLRQELNRLQSVLVLVRKTLNDIVLAIGGTIVISTGIKASINAMYDAKTPPSWQNISWDSVSIGFWFTELLERHSQIQLWLNKGRPKAFWMTGFFNPQGFLTAMRQEVTRAHRGWALDSVVMQNTITRFSIEQITSPPPEGVYVYGLYLEGGSLDKKTGKLVECQPKVLYEMMPVIYMYAISSTSGKDPRLYECPIYRKPMRAEHNYIGSVDFETDIGSGHWVLRGAALLCDIK